jgi:hypothetical protein
MRPWSTFRFYNCASGMSEPRLPAPRPEDARHTSRRRMEDQIETVYNKARAANDLEAAADLLALLEKWLTRRAARLGKDRRMDRANLNRVRREMQVLTRSRRPRV